VYLSIYRYRAQELTVDSRQMIKSETDTVQPADERYTDRRQMRTDL
jgi:hypothetical protein